MKSLTKVIMMLLTFSLAFSCGEKDLKSENPPQQEEPSQPSQPDQPSDPDAPGIRTAEDLVEFASLVNANESYAKFQDENGGVGLLSDIDMSSVTSWTPIGYAKCAVGINAPEISGSAWTGVFDGNGHRITNLKLVSAGSEEGMNYGLFGVLAPGAVVQNFTIDASCSLEVTATASLATGVVAGYVYDATVRDVTSYAPMTFKGKAGEKFMSMALVGQIYSSKIGVTMDSCHNYGDILAENTDNTQAGANAYHIAGLVGFAQAAADATVENTISDSSNGGNMTSATARTSGIVAAMNLKTKLVNCVNEGDQLNTMSKVGGGRPGNIACIAGNGCKMTNCINKGNLVSTTEGRCGGIVSLANNGVVFEGCQNYGEVLTDSQYRGLFWGYNASTVTWRNCTAAGKVGTYNNNSPVYDSYTEATKTNYLGYHAKSSATLDNITYQVGIKEPDPSQEVKADLNILFIGNSFTQDAVTHLPGLLKAADLDKTIHMVHMYKGGRLVSQYYSGWNTSSDYMRYECLPGATSWSSTPNTNLAEVAASKQWDIVTIQEHTGNAEAWTWNSDAKSNIQGLVDKVKEVQGDNVPKFYYIMSQAYYNMNKIGTGSRPFMTWDDQDGMWEVIASFGKNVMDNVTFDGIISTGVMLQNLRTSSLDNTMNLSRDGYHMDYGISRYGAACTVFETIITPNCGNVKLDNNSYRYNVSDTSDSGYTTPVTDENAPIALQAARYAIQNPYDVTSMSEGNSVDKMDYEIGNKE